MDDRVIPLAADFEAASRADWLAMAAKALPSPAVLMRANRVVTVADPY